MAIDPISPAWGAPAALPGVAPPATSGGQDFAAVLNAQQQRAAEDLPTVTFGQMTGMTPTFPAPVLATAAAVPVAAPPAASATQMTWPVQGGGRVSSEFGPRVHPVTGAHRDHLGIDVAAPTGTAIVAAAGGEVTFAGQQGGYGNVVIIDHGNGTETRYAHQDSMAVSVGQRVEAGERIGAVGSTGLSTGPHLHFEVRRDGQAVNPRRFIG